MGREIIGEIIEWAASSKTTRLNRTYHCGGVLARGVMPVVLMMAALLGACTADNPYLAEATRYTDRAIQRGIRADPNGLAEQATIALRYAWLAEREKKDGRLEQAIQELKEAIMQARYGRYVAGTEAAERAAVYLSEIE